MTDEKPQPVYKVKYAGGREQEFVYSPEFRTYMDEVKEQLRSTRRLFLCLMILFTLGMILLALIYFNTGIIGRYLAYGVCT